MRTVGLLDRHCRIMPCDSAVCEDRTGGLHEPIRYGMAHQVSHNQALACQASPRRQHLDKCCGGQVVQKERRDHEIDATFSKGQGKHITLDKSDFGPSLHVLPRPPQMRMAPVERIDLQWDSSVTRPSRHHLRDGTASSSQVEDTHMAASTIADPRVEM